MATYTPIRIVLADDHEIFRDGFNGLFHKESSITPVGEAANGQELVSLVKQTLPDVVLTDIRMPIMDGIAATRLITASCPQVAVIALSMFNDDNLVIDMMEAGAKGYLLKNAHKSEIIEAIKTVYNQEYYFCRQTSQKMIKLMAHSRFNPKKPQQPKVTFSAKEIEVITLICQQYANKEISEKMNFSIRTIEGYRLRIQEKMMVKNSAGIVIYAIKNGIFQID